MTKSYVWLTCAFILSLSAAVPAWPDSLQVQTSVKLPSGFTKDQPNCFPYLSTCTAMTVLSNLSGSGSGTASANFGFLDVASRNAPSGVGASGEADATASFSDSFSVLSGNGSGSFEIDFVTSGAAVSADTASGTATGAITLNMQVGSGTTVLKSFYSIVDCAGCGGFSTIGLPTTIFTIDAEDGQTVFFSATVAADSYGEGVASAVDPVNVFIKAPTGFTISTASGTDYSSTPNPTPEPGSLLLLSSALACLGAWRRKLLNRI